MSGVWLVLKWKATGASCFDVLWTEKVTMEVMGDQEDGELENRSG